MRISDWSSDVCSSDLRFAAEKVYAFELGAKFSGRRWSANIAAFREEFSNFQLNTFNGTSFVVQNINGCGTALTAGRCDSDDVEAGLISQGFELEMTATPIRNLQATGGITSARAKFSDRRAGRSEERRVGQEGVRTCRIRW